MRRMVFRLGGLVLGVGLLLAARPAAALITLPTPLSGVLNEAKFICVANVDAVDPKAPGMVLAVDETLKGKAPFQKLAVNLTGDAESLKKKDTAEMLKRVAPKLPIVLFVNQNDKTITIFGFTNGTWFQMVGTQGDDGDTLRIGFTHCEPYLRRTFKGTTAELKQTTVDGLAGKKDPPNPDLKEKPGLGPEVEAPEKKDERQSRIMRGPPFAVIPSVVIMAPLAILAMLFPAVFGGLILVMRRWMAALTVLSIDTSLYAVQMYFGPYLVGTWWGTPPALWLTVSLVTLAGAVWAWRRHADRVAAAAAQTAVAPRDATAATEGAHATALPGPVRSDAPSFTPPTADTFRALAAAQTALRAAPVTAPAPVAVAPPATPPAPFESPGRIELIALGVLSLLFIGSLVILPRLPRDYGLWDKNLAMVTTICGVGLWAATLYAAALWVVARWRAPRQGLPGEGVLLAAMLLGCLGFAVTLTNETRATEEVQTSDGDMTATALFKPTDPAWIASSPRVDGDRIYVGVVHGTAFRSGALYCLNRTTGEKLWMFNDHGAMKDVFSSPCVADGRVFIGEGFHQHSGCKLFCLDADTGAKRWEVRTGSHTESSPCVAEGRVYCGAGDDGLLCVDAVTGKEIWHEGRGLHVDANPLVVDGRVYCGSGVGDAYRETCVFCLDAVTGKEVWRKPTELPVWGGATVAGDRAYVGIGNGNFMESADSPAGALLCLEATTGKQLWRCDAKDGVHVRPAVYRGCVYFASRDQNCYCVDRANGMVIWKRDLGSPVVASPSLAGCPECGGGVSLFAAAGDGQLYCLDPATGDVDWVFDAAKKHNLPVELFSSPAVVVSHEIQGYRRRVYFGCGLNYFQSGVLYCVEDVRKRPSAAK